MPDHGAQRRDAPPTRRTRRSPEGSQPGPLTRLVASVRGGRIRESLARTPGLILALAAVVGLLTGLFAVALIELVQVVQRLAFGTTPGSLTIVAVTTLGGLAVGTFITYVVPEARGGGVTQVMETIALHSGRMRARVAPGKVVAASLSIGVGASGGREAPIVQVGGAVGSLCGRLAALSEDRKRELIAAGAAAGIAAAFNAPVGGMLFAIEVILGGFRMRYLQVIVIASVVSSVTARELVGEGLIYRPPSYQLGSPSELVLYAALGIAAAGVGWAFMRGEHLAIKLFERVKVWLPLRTMAGGLIVGLLALLVPEILGSGDDLPPIEGAIQQPVAALLAGRFAEAFDATGFTAVGLLLLLLVAKFVATCISIGAGFAVGSFGPAFFLGAALGAAFGHAAATLFPGVTVEPGALALAGMAAVIGAAAKAPLTGILIVFELTGDYSLVLPLMLAVGIATFTADRFSSDSIYTLPLRRRGIVYSEPEDIDIMQSVRVGEIMTRNPETVPANEPIEEVQHRFRRTGPRGFPVVSATDPHELVGVLTVSDLARALERATEEDAGYLARTTAGDICTRNPLTVTSADPAFRAVQRMASSDIGRLPVVRAENHRRLVGLVRRADIVTAYQRALGRMVESQHRAADGIVRDLVGTRTLELAVDDDSEVAGQLIRDVGWPARTIVTSIRRNTDVITPSGDTRIQPGDVLVAITGEDQVERLREKVSSPQV